MADISAYLFDQSESTIELPQDCKIYVFNEDYIDQNVKIDDDLETIILLGGQVDLQFEIDRYIEMERRTYAEKESAQKSLEQYEDLKNPNSPAFHHERIRKSLQAGWSTRDSAIKGSKTASKVTAAVIKGICELSVSETAPQLQKKFFVLFYRNKLINRILQNVRKKFLHWFKMVNNRLSNKRETTLVKKTPKFAHIVLDRLIIITNLN